MEDWQKRVIEERDELIKRIRKLREFTETDTFASLPADDRADLAQQLSYMTGYLVVLNTRILKF